MKRKLFTFLVAFLATLSGAVWGQEQNPIEVNLNNYNDEPYLIEDNGIYHVFGSNEKGIEIDRKASPTIILDGIKIDVTGTAIEVKGEAQPTFILKGENSIQSENGPAISVPHDVSTKATFQGDGLLEITMQGGNDKIAMGSSEGGGLGVTCGNIIIEGGTIKTNGTLGNFLTGRKFTLTGNGVLICSKINDGALDNRELTGGILFEGENTMIGTMYGDVTLNSPLPEGYVVDLTRTLTIGEGNSINTDQIQPKGGTLNAYEVEYLSEFKDDNSALPATKYYGPNYTVASWNAGFDQEKSIDEGSLTYVQSSRGWFINDNDDDDVDFELSNETTEYFSEEPQGIETVRYQAAWYLSNAKLEYIDFTSQFEVGYPAAIRAMIKEGDNDELSNAGLQIEDETLIKSSGDKAKAGLHTIHLIYGDFLPDVEGTIVANVQGMTYDLTDEDLVKVLIKPSKLPYRAEGYMPKDFLNVSINLYPEWGWMYSERIYEGFSVECDGKPFPEEGLINAGKYSITVKADEGSNLTGEVTGLSFEITPKEVSVTAEPLQWQLGSDPEVTPTFRINWNDVFESDIAGVGLARYTANLSDYTEAGPYTIIYKDVQLALSGSAIGNYICDSEIEGDLTVLEAEAPITSSDFEISIDDDIPYFGGDVASYLKVVYDEDKIAAPDEYTATYYKMIDGAWLPMASAPIQVGVYKVVVKGKGDLLKEEEKEVSFAITPRPLSVEANSVVWEQGEDTQKEVTFIITDGLLPNDQAVVYVEKMSIDVSGWTPGVHENVNYSVIGEVKLGGMAAENYYIKGNVYGTVTIEAPEPSDPEVEVPDGWKLTHDGFIKVYDGQSYELETLQITVDGRIYTMVKDVDFTLEREGSDKEQVIKDAGVYTFTVRFTNATLYNPAQVTFTVLKRQMAMAFNLPAQIETLAPMAIQADHLNPELQTGKRGLVSGETPLVVAKGQFLFGKPNAENKCAVTVSDFALAETDKFNPANYRLQIWDAEQGIVDYKGGDITIIDPENPDPNNPNEPSDGTVVDPDYGGGEGDHQPSKNFCNIYVADGSSPYIQFNPSRKVVEAVGKITVDVVIPDEIGTEDVKLTFRRGDGAWEALTMDEVTKKYTIKDINTHIYLKAEVDAALLDAEPNENHVYIDLSCTKDGIKLDAEREIVENGDNVLIKAEVSKENQNKAIKYEYKVTRFGAWKELKATEKAGEFIIWNVTNDVFVRAYLADQTEDPETAKEAHHVYSDLSVTCEGVYLDADRKMVANNGTTKVYLTINPNYNTENAHYMFRRGIDEAWEELTPSTEANVFVITGIETDIYLKATDAVTTGTEDALSETTRVYTQDGMLYVYTAQQEEVSVISMIGAVVKRTQQTGLQSYPLNQGIYVVQVGEQVFKVRVK